MLGEPSTGITALTVSGIFSVLRREREREREREKEKEREERETTRDSSI